MASGRIGTPVRDVVLENPTAINDRKLTGLSDWKQDRVFTPYPPASPMIQVNQLEQSNQRRATV